MIHPGYGFLSENGDFAAACRARGLAFIGPGAEVIRRMGDKTEARLAMQQAGIPVTPGSDGNLDNLDHALAVAATLGYPVTSRRLPAAAGAASAAATAPRTCRATTTA